MIKKDKKIVPVLSAIIFNEKNEILIARRKPGMSQALKWEFPGGKLKPGESPEECLKREIKEELGINIQVEKIFHAVNYSYPDKNILLLAYISKYISGCFNLKDHSEFRWEIYQKLKNYDFSKADIPVVEKLEKEMAN